MSEVHECVARLVEECCVALFSHYQIAIAPSAATPRKCELALCGVIGFTGDDLRGSLMLACSREPLGISGVSSDLEMRDWLAELTNQLLGRVKNRLLGFGTAIYCATPVVIGGERIARIESQPLGHLFTADGGVVSVWFDMEVRPDFMLVPVEESHPVALEGETLLF